MLTVSTSSSDLTDAKVRQVAGVQKNKSQLTNINYLSTDFQFFTFLKIKKNKIRNAFLLPPLWL